MSSRLPLCDISRFEIPQDIVTSAARDAQMLIGDPSIIEDVYAMRAHLLVGNSTYVTFDSKMTPYVNEKDRRDRLHEQLPGLSRVLIHLCSRPLLFGTPRNRNLATRFTINHTAIGEELPRHRDGVSDSSVEPHSATLVAHLQSNGQFQYWDRSETEIIRTVDTSPGDVMEAYTEANFLDRWPHSVKATRSEAGLGETKPRISLSIRTPLQ